VRHALDAGDYQKAHHLTHDIKGLSGNLAAFDLQAAAAELDNFVRGADKDNPPPEAALSQALAAFETQMDRALQSARQLKSAAAEPGPQPSPESAGRVPPDLAGEAARRLREAVETGDVTGVAAIVREMASRSKAFEPYRCRIAELADNFDFDGILAICDELENA
jgi:HPt (histidine-containing phosphotransfer) domain-containing protein